MIQGAPYLNKGAVDMTSEHLDEASGAVDKASESSDETSGAVDKASKPLDEASRAADKASGAVEITLRSWCLLTRISNINILKYKKIHVDISPC